jgi:hypothetical protein
MGEINRQIAKSSNISLHRSTTYSGADIKVFIYRDLVELTKNLDKKQFNSRDGQVVVSEDTQGAVTLLDDRLVRRDASLTDGGSVSKGQLDPSKDISKKVKPTNVIDQVYTDRHSSVSSFLERGESTTSNAFDAMGIDDVIAELGSLYAVNYSSFREKAAVRTLGRTHARNYTRGQRTIAGTMVFNVLQSHELLRFGNSIGGNYSMLDQLEPFNLILFFTNEYGAHSVLHLFNVDVNTESQSMSIDDLLLTNTMNFYCQDMLPMEDVGNVFNSTAEMLHASIADKRFESFQQQMSNNKRTGLGSISNALGNDSSSDKRIQTLLKRSRGLF